MTGTPFRMTNFPEDPRESALPAAAVRVQAVSPRQRRAHMGYVVSSPFPFWIPLFIFGAPLILWIGLASTLTRRDVVDRPNRIAQWYGYSVCLVALVTLLFSSVSIVNNLFTLANPLQGEYDFGPSLSSFEAYRATYHQSPFLDQSERAALLKAPPTAAELRLRYEALRADRIERNRYQAQRSLVTGGLLSLFSVALFLLHWRWIRRLGSGPAEPAAQPAA